MNGVERERRDAGAVRLVVDADRDVDRLDVVVRADVAVRVRRVALAPVGEVEAVEAGVRGRRRRGDHLALLDHLRQLRGGAGGVLEPLGGAAAGGSEAGGRALGALLLDDVALQLADVEDLAVGRLQVQLTRVGVLDRLGQVPADGLAVLEGRGASSAPPAIEGCSDAARVTATWAADCVRGRARPDHGRDRRQHEDGRESGSRAGRTVQRSGARALARRPPPRRTVIDAPLSLDPTPGVSQNPPPAGYSTAFGDPQWALPLPRLALPHDQVDLCTVLQPPAALRGSAR